MDPSIDPRPPPNSLRYEHQLIVGEGDYVIVHGRFSGHGPPVAESPWILSGLRTVDLPKIWDVLQDEATKAESKSGLPMFGDVFAA